MDAGQYKYPISVRTAAVVEDAVGQPEETWDEFVARRAARDLKGARRWWSEPKFLVELNEVFVVRLCSTTEQITEAMKVQFKGRLLSIQSVVIDYDARDVVLGCSEIRENVG